MSWTLHPTELSVVAGYTKCPTSYVGSVVFRGFNHADGIYVITSVRIMLASLPEKEPSIVVAQHE